MHEQAGHTGLLYYEHTSCAVIPHHHHSISSNKGQEGVKVGANG